MESLDRLSKSISVKIDIISVIQYCNEYHQQGYYFSFSSRLCTNTYMHINIQYRKTRHID